MVMHTTITIVVVICIIAAIIANTIATTISKTWGEGEDGVVFVAWIALGALEPVAMARMMQVMARLRL